MNSNIFINLSYIAAAICFILGLKLMNSPATARKGNFISAIGMLVAILVTLLSKDIIGYKEIVLGIGIGTIIGIFAAYFVAMTAMPEMVALLNGFGGLASLLVGWSEYHNESNVVTFTAVAIFLTILIGAVTFSGSMIAWAKLKEVMPGRPILFKGQQMINAILLLVSLILGVIFCMNPATHFMIFIALIILSLLLGILIVIPIGGADMPVVISLLNSYSGLAACAAGFIICNNVLIVSGALVGASGIILSHIMCKAMNRSLSNVLFGGFGAVKKQTKGKEEKGEVQSLSPKEAYYVLEAAQSVVFVPGYGLAVAQAQHVLKELGNILENNGTDVKYAIHPVAGRMPGHMNVLLAEANVSYDELVDMDDINPLMNSVDVCVVIGANDVVNPAAREDQSSPIYGMPIINVDYAKNVFVLKRSMAKGFAGIPNPLFYKENTSMIFGDAKATLNAIVAEFKE